MIDRTKLMVVNGSPFDPSLYEVVLRSLLQEEGGGWLATIPALPGCTGDGESEIEAIGDVRLAALEWADAAVAEGESLPVPRHAAAVAE